MAFFGQTPESLLPRSDSRNPATTCKGITTNGRPCRRDIGARDEGVLAVVSVASDSDEDDTGAAAFFCWQHKDQAERLAAATAAAASNGHATQLYPLKERNSIDTLVARLGVLEVDEPAQTPQQKRKRNTRMEERASAGNKPSRRVNRPPTWDKVQGPLISVPSDLMAEKNRRNHRQEQQPPPKRSGFWAMCCGGSADDDLLEEVKHKRTHGQAALVSSHASESLPQAPHQVRPGQTGRTHRSSTSRIPVAKPVASAPERKPLGEKPARPLNKTSPGNSETTNLLSYIPSTLSPQLTSSLLSELSKPISPSDDEGYIYIFWLTPESLGSAPSSAASALLVPPSRPEQGRRTSDLLRQYSVKSPRRPRPDAPRTQSGDSNIDSSNEKNTILLKIGRANNVHRRMNEWTRQCGYSLSLVRFYPYVSTTPSPSPHTTPQASPANSRRPSYQNKPTDPVRRVSEGVRKVPHVHRVERLIHIELGSQRVVKKCDACGKDHREWFEVDATREGVKAVDEVVKRWVSWAERANN